MRNPFQPGDLQTFERRVREQDLARFEAEGLVHPVYSSFALARDAEWTCRQFVLAMKEAGEEGVGSALSLRHVSPAPLGALVRIVARLEAVEGRAVHCSYRAYVGERLIAEGDQEQHILDAERFRRQLAALQGE